ncbi:hypothetical protein CHF27_012680 [Romboutsia maritimum]|uniref:Molecular chaperone DnaJ n=1 Tax=Romboutsia maritimum TaxID=2020948 RepID=A0A371IQ25_9FIRM|nr:hypothetical protein [Romboutsia maritimum]RDY22573.1 hypothetical protein CHF27_012680 [Romboutsia maritimum]
MYSNAYDNDSFVKVRRLIENKEFKKAYEFLQTITNKCSEWYYLNGISAMKIGYYEEGENCINQAKAMNPENKEYDNTLTKFSRYRDDYNDRAYNYNRRRRSDLDGCCCCCCGDDCCENCVKLWCLDSCCECCGGDLVSCF